MKDILKRENTQDTEIVNSSSSTTPKIPLSVLESRILLYLLTVISILKSTNHIFAKFNENTNNYSYLCQTLRNLETKKLIKSHNITGGKRKAWYVPEPIKEKVMKMAYERLEKEHQKNQKVSKNEDVLEEKGEKNE